MNLYELLWIIQDYFELLFDILIDRPKSISLIKALSIMYQFLKNLINFQEDFPLKIPVISSKKIFLFINLYYFLISQNNLILNYILRTLVKSDPTFYFTANYLRYNT